MGGTYFDDEEEIGAQGLTLLRKVLADLFRDHADVSGADEELGLAKWLSGSSESLGTFLLCATATEGNAMQALSASLKTEDLIGARNRLTPAHDPRRCQETEYSLDT